ncbi:MAG TPA: hypothetical protein VNO50_16435 [Pyrinomonadaceae bacterium]|nr:hypothetical protein [Pyrinomonadaceae bacterium]
MTTELTTREDLIDTLHLAAELEHNLMCQYWFAAYSMKRSTSEGLSEVQLEKTRGRDSLMMMVARRRWSEHTYRRDAERAEYKQRPEIRSALSAGEVRRSKKSQESQDVRKESGPAGMAGVVRRRA